MGAKSGAPPSSASDPAKESDDFIARMRTQDRCAAAMAHFSCRALSDFRWYTQQFRRKPSKESEKKITGSFPIKLFRFVFCGISTVAREGFDQLALPFTTGMLNYARHILMPDGFLPSLGTSNYEVIPQRGWVALGISARWKSPNNECIPRPAGPQVEQTL